MQYSYNTPLMRGASGPYNLPTTSPHAPYSSQRRSRKRSGGLVRAGLAITAVLLLCGGFLYLFLSGKSQGLPGESSVRGERSVGARRRTQATHVHDEPHEDHHDAYHGVNEHVEHHDDWDLIHQRHEGTDIEAEIHRYSEENHAHFEEHGHKYIRDDDDHMHLTHPTDDWSHHHEAVDGDHHYHPIEHHDLEHHLDDHYVKHGIEHDDLHGLHHSHHEDGTITYHEDFDHDDWHEPVIHSSNEEQHLSDHLGLYDMGFSPTDIYGKHFSLSELKGKVVLFVNVASQCGYTQSNYLTLQQLYMKYKHQGFEIIAFPCNDFGAQEPQADADIASYVQARFHVTFKLMSKITDANHNPIFTWLRAHAPAVEGDPNSHPGDDLSWNFNKFLVDKWGRPMRRYDSADHRSELDHDIALAVNMPYDEHAFDDLDHHAAH